ncbi:DUF998 domain-containing protein [Mucilaginibacter sp. BT774]|uniref:DUF998 domain-containing protein n=1 Tax=Mucilaginibacter sp. BT774 TaxID=3062276 RepID=UPI0026744335|nr:DUF998 domain-containing protein [Mucilaginibacter sp. BT774]MDO3624628.1 DUF998 domain-containing protein [Mucilaginibacter sp. BT774]
MSEPDAGSHLLIPRTNLQTALLCSGIIGAVLFTTVYFCFGVISPNYYMIHEPIGRLQLQPYGWIQSVNYILAGLFICIFAIGLRNEMVSGFGLVLIPFCHIVTGLGCIVLGLSLDPQIQLYAGDFTFASLVAGFLLLVRRFAADPQWRGWVIYTMLSVALMIVLCALFTYSIAHQGRLTGVFERLIIITRLVWLFFFTAKLLGGRSLASVDKREIQAVTN